MDLDAPLGTAAYHWRYVHQNERWLNYTRRLKIRHGIEAYRNPGLNLSLIHISEPTRPY